MAGLNLEIPFPPVLVVSANDLYYVVPLDIIILMLRGSGVSVVDILNSLVTRKKVPWNGYTFALPPAGVTDLEAHLPGVKVCTQVDRSLDTLTLPPRVVTGLETRILIEELESKE